MYVCGCAHVCILCMIYLFKQDLLNSSIKIFCSFLQFFVNLCTSKFINDCCIPEFNKLQSYIQCLMPSSVQISNIKSPILCRLLSFYKFLFIITASTFTQNRRRSNGFDSQSYFIKFLHDS